MSERSSEGQRLKTHELLEAVPVAIYEIDAQGRILFTNSAYASITGYSVDELMGMRVQDLMAPGRARDSMTAMFEQLVVDTPDPFPFVAKNLTRDGRFIDVEILWDYRRDDEGRVMGFVCALQDATMRVRSERDVRLSEERFRGVFDQSPWGMVVYDLTGRPLYVNPAQLAIMGLSVEELETAMRSYNILEDEQLVAKGLRPIIDRGFAGEPLAIPEALYEPRKMQPPLDHDPIWLRGFIYPVQVSAGDVSEVVVFFEDITEGKEAEERHAALDARLQEAQKVESLSVLAGGIAHDFNNMLVAILGNADLARVDLPPESPVGEALSDIVAGASGAAALVRQLLAYSGRSQASKELLDLTALVGEVSHLIDAAVSTKAVIRHDLADNLPAVEVDSTQLRQVVMNLIINASESLGGDAGTIRIRTGVEDCDTAYLADSYLLDDLPAGTYCFIEVEDNGAGMDSATLERLFEPFFTTKFTGRGLGLAAVLGIVRGHQGTIKVRSELGGGTTFTVLLPAAAATPSLERDDERARDWRGQGSILLVDDDPPVRAVAERMLERLGFDVVTAGDGQEALGVVSENLGRFVCVLLDSAMPRMDGAECLKELERIQPELPVLVCSGYAQHALADQFASVSPAAFIQKPYRLADLSEAVQAVLRAP